MPQMSQIISIFLPQPVIFEKFVTTHCALDRRIDTLTGEIQSLAGKYEEQIHTHNSLLHHINLNNENFTESNLSNSAEAPADLKKK